VKRLRAVRSGVDTTVFSLQAKARGICLLATVEARGISLLDTAEASLEVVMAEISLVDMAETSPPDMVTIPRDLAVIGPLAAAVRRDTAAVSPHMAVISPVTAAVNLATVAATDNHSNSEDTKLEFFSYLQTDRFMILGKV